MIIKIFLGVLIGWITSIGLTQILSILKLGFPLIKEELSHEVEIIHIKSLRRLKIAYYISLFIWLIICFGLFACIFFFIRISFIGYGVVILLTLPQIISSTKMNPDYQIVFYQRLAKFESNKMEMK